MDYTVTVETLREHAKSVAGIATAVGSQLSQVRLDVASSAMGGGMAASVSRSLQERFNVSSKALVTGLSNYAEGISDTARNYAEQEERGADAISSFFGK